MDVGIAAIKVYPNPATNELFIEFENEVYNQIAIADISGRTVISINDNQLESVKIDIAQLAGGVYTIQFANEKNIKVIKLAVAGR